MIACLCSNVSADQIEHAIELGVDTLEELKEIYQVACTCGCCEETMNQLIKEAKRGNKS